MCFVGASRICRSMICNIFFPSRDFCAFRYSCHKLTETFAALSWNEEGVEDSHGLKIVVISGLFDPKDLEDAVFLKELEESLVAECSKFGELAKVTIIERNPKGVAIIKVCGLP